jgi:DNA-binding response OmpR family regulator
MYLPKHDGEDILKHLRSTKYYAQTPMIVMTSLDSSRIGERTEGYPALDYFHKSSTMDEFMQLGSVVRGVLDSGKPSGGKSALNQQIETGPG